VQYLAQVADVRKRLAETCLLSGKWGEAIKQIQAIEALPLREDNRQQMLQECAALLEAALRDNRLPAESPEAALIKQQLQKLRS
jgi:hypothetical protein